MVVLAVACSSATGEEPDSTGLGRSWDALAEVPSVRILVPTRAAGLVEQRIPVVGGVVTATASESGARVAAIHPNDEGRRR